MSTLAPPGGHSSLSLSGAPGDDGGGMFANSPRGGGEGGGERVRIVGGRVVGQGQVGGGGDGGYDNVNRDPSRPRIVGGKIMAPRPQQQQYQQPPSQQQYQQQPQQYGGGGGGGGEYDQRQQPGGNRAPHSSDSSNSLGGSGGGGGSAGSYFREGGGGGGQPRAQDLSLTPSRDQGGRAAQGPGFTPGGASSLDWCVVTVCERVPIPVNCACLDLAETVAALGQGVRRGRS